MTGIADYTKNSLIQSFFLFLPNTKLLALAIALEKNYSDSFEVSRFKNMKEDATDPGMLLNW